ncbi:MAG TPA: histidine kinase, partial [Trebonia sp.]
RGAWRPTRGLPFGWWAVLVCVAYAALVGWGMLLRANHALITSLRERAERAEAEQDRRIAEARTMERTRIAREMHDVLAHRLSLLATYAGAISYRPDAPPDQLSRAAEVIRSGAHQALEELREVITVLRDDQPGEDPDAGDTGGRPLPGYADLSRLVDESRAAGMRIEVSNGAWDQETVPSALGRTVYRVVQEGLTNARKHAPGEEVRVVLSGAPGAALEIGIVNRIPAQRAAPAPPGTGTGLIGLSERLALAGGRLECRSARGADGAGDAEFVLRAWLSWPA